MEFKEQLPPPLKIKGEGKGHNFKDYSNQELNNIKILYPVSKSADGHIQYLMRCHCGNFFISLPKRVKNGNTKSCGCLKKQKIIERNQEKTSEIIGKTYGFLQVLEFSHYKKYKTYHKSFYKCFCKNCNNISYHSGSDLKNGSIQSCGCINSRKETEIAYLLKQNNIDYIRQYTFSDLKGNKGKPLRFDFAIFKNKEIICLIEYQGQQHYEKDNPWHTKELEENDKVKKDYCSQNKIRLIELNKESQLSDLIQIINGDVSL